MYTIEDFRNGKVTLVNDNRELTIKVIEKAFPTKDSPSGHMNYYAGTTHSVSSIYNDWISYDSPPFGLPTQLASDFLEVREDA